MAKTSKKKADRVLSVYLFNVGQGENILIEFPNGEFGIIDFYWDWSLGLKEPPALSYLDWLSQKNGKKPVISFICLSHPDEDHIKGLDTFLNWVDEKDITVKGIWLFAGKSLPELVAHFRKTFKKYGNTEADKYKAVNLSEPLRALAEFLPKWEKKGNRPQYLRDMRPVGTIGDAKVVLIAPLDSHIRDYDDKEWEKFCKMLLNLDDDKDKHGEGNLMSSVLLINFFKHRLLFGGDTGLKIWLDCLNQFETEFQADYFGPYKSNFVKASHHGSKYSSSEDLWKRILEEKAYVGISAGRKYKHKHPHSDTISNIRIVKTEARIFSTNICRKCSKKEQVQEEKVDWFSYSVKTVTPEEETAFSATSSPYYEAELSPPSLAAYIFRFPVNSDALSVIKAVTKSTVGYTDCIYGGIRREVFPECSKKVF